VQKSPIKVQYSKLNVQSCWLTCAKRSFANYFLHCYVCTCYADSKRSVSDRWLIKENYFLRPYVCTSCADSKRSVSDRWLKNDEETACGTARLLGALRAIVALFLLYLVLLYQRLDLNLTLFVSFLMLFQLFLLLYLLLYPLFLRCQDCS